MDRRTFLKGLVATAAGVLIPASVAAEPERRVWALDRTMVGPRSYGTTLITLSDYDLMRLAYDSDSRWITIGNEHMRMISVVPHGASYHADVLVERGSTAWQMQEMLQDSFRSGWVLA